LPDVDLLYGLKMVYYETINAQSVIKMKSNGTCLNNVVYVKPSSWHEIIHLAGERYLEKKDNFVFLLLPSLLRSLFNSSRKSTLKRVLYKPVADHRAKCTAIDVCVV